MKRDSQHGAMLVFVAGFILPLIFVLMSVALDVQAYTNKLEEMQSIADNAVLFGARFLPDTQAAQTMIASFVTSRDANAHYSVSSAADIVSLTVSDSFSPFFGTFFDKALNITTAIPYSATAEARAAPLDVFIGIDRSGYLSPDFSLADDGAWGDAGQWGAADVFTALLTIPFRNGVMGARIATQQCFNPPYVLIKKAAVRAFDFFSSFALNRVAVNFFPGAVSLVGKSRDINAGGTSQEAITFYDTRLDWDVDHYVTVAEYEDPSSFPVQSLHCASIAESEPFFTEYRIPEAPAYLSTSNGGAFLVNQADWSLNDDYPLMIREKIWSRATNKYESMDTGVVINAMKQALFNAGQKSDRRGLVNNAAQVGFIITNKVPVIGGISFTNGNDVVAQQIHDLFSELRAMKSNQHTKLTFYYVLLGGTLSEAQALDTFFSGETLSNELGETLFEPKVIRGEDPEIFLSKIFSSIVLQQRSHAVSK